MSVPNKLVCGKTTNGKKLCFSNSRAPNGYLPSTKYFSVGMDEGVKYKCPKYYKKISGTNSIMIGGESKHLDNSLIMAKDIKGKNKIDGKTQVLVGCELDKYTSDKDKARCYMNDIPQGQSIIEYDYSNKQYVINNKDRCPPLDADSKHVFMTSYCSDFDGVMGNKELCNEWWNEDGGSKLQNRDRLAANLCRQDKYKNMSECACINAKPPRDLPEAVAWIFNAECGDPTKNAYHTQNMGDITWQDCRQYWDINDIHDSTIRNVSMEQTCNMSFPDSKPAADTTPNIPSNMPDVIPSNIPDKPSNKPDKPGKPDKPSNKPDKSTDESEDEGMLNQEINGIKLIYIIFFFILILVAALYFVSRSRRSNYDYTDEYNDDYDY